MAERNWRDEFEEEDRDGDMVIDVWYRNGRALGYATKFAEKEIVCDASHLVPKPKPVTYRPYKRGEVKCGDVFQGKMYKQHSMVVCVEGEKDAVILGSGTLFTYQELFDAFTHLDGTPAGVKE